MAGELQPLDQQFSIVDSEGKPTLYFIRWAQQRQLDIGTALTLEDLGDYLAAHMFSAAAGSGIGLTPDGNLANSPAITAKVQEILDQISAVRGTVLYRGAAGWAGLAPGAAGQFLKTNGAGADPAWAAAGGGGGSSPYPMTVPDNTLFSWVNQGGATVTVNGNGSVTIRAPKAAATSLRCRVMPIVAAPYTVTLGMISSSRRLVTAQAAGLVLRDSVSGKLKVWAWHLEASGSYFVPQNFGSPTAYTSNIFGSVLTQGGYGPQFFRLVDDGTNISFQISNDGYQFIELGTVGRTVFMTADQVGFYAWEGTNSYELTMTAFHWSLTQP